MYTFHMYHTVYITLVCLRTRWVLSGLSLRERLTLFTKAYFSPHTKTQQTKKTPVYRMRGQIYSQSGSRVIRLDAFLEWSFLSLLLSFSEVSPRLPPLPQHSSLLFILYKYNQKGPHWNTFSPSVGLSFIHTHVRKHTHIHSSRTHISKGSCWWSVVGLSKDHRPATTQIYTHMLPQ